jgi:hypothetical protein
MKPRYYAMFVVAALIVWFHPYRFHPTRYGQLKCIINRHTGFAHLTRGMNVNTIKALRSRTDAADIPVLIQMLDDKDHVSQMTAAEVLAQMGEPGLNALREERAKMGQQTGANYNRFSAVEDAITAAVARKGA